MQEGPRKKNKALFLDRDGVICEAMPRGEYITRWEQFTFMPGIAELILDAKKKGYVVFVVTNQSQVRRGLMREEDLRDIHSRMQRMLPGIDHVYYCHHIDEDNCECRKPKPGLLLHAQKEFAVDLENSIMVGDSDRDILAGQAVGCKAVFVKNTFNTHELARCVPDTVVGEISEVRSLLG